MFICTKNKFSVFNEIKLLGRKIEAETIKLNLADQIQHYPFCVTIAIDINTQYKHKIL